MLQLHGCKCTWTLPLQALSLCQSRFRFHCQFHKCRPHLHSWTSMCNMGMSCNTISGTSTWTDCPSYCEGLGLLRMTSFGVTLQRNSCQICCKLRCPKRFHKFVMPLRAQSWVHLTVIGLALSTTNITENSTVHTGHNRLILTYLGRTKLVLSWTCGMLHGT